MVLMEWNAGLVLGVASMDKEHQDLVAAMNRVHDLATQKADKRTVDVALLHLVQLTKKHFADEEQHMERIGFEGRRIHARIHEDLLEKVGTHYAAFQAGDGTVPQAFFDFLVHWLRAHILGIDRKYAQVPVPK